MCPSGTVHWSVTLRTEGAESNLEGKWRSVVSFTLCPDISDGGTHVFYLSEYPLVRNSLLQVKVLLLCRMAHFKNNIGYYKHNLDSNFHKIINNVKNWLNLCFNL